VGIEQEKLADIYKDMRDRIGDFIQTGGGPMVDFFERVAPQVGVTAEQFRKLSGPQALQLFVSSMEQAGLSGNELVFQMEAMASDSTLLLPLLQSNGQALRALGDEAERAGRILSEIDVARLELAGQQMAKFDQTMETVKNQLGAQLAPILAGVANLIDQAAQEAGGFGNLIEQNFQKVIDGAAFIMDSIEGVKRVFQVAGRTGVLAFLKLEEQLWQAADTIVNGPAAATNDFIGLLNKVPGVDIERVGMSGLGRDIYQNLQTARSATQIAMQDIQDILMEPMPSHGIKEWVKEVQQSADEAAKTLQQRMSEAMSQEGAGMSVFSDDESEKKRQEKVQQQREEALRRMEEENKSRLEILLERAKSEEILHAEHLQRLRDLDTLHREQGLISEQEYQEQRLKSMQDYMEQQVGIQRSGYDAMNSIVAKGLGAEAGMVTDALGSMINSMSSQSKKAFEIKKALAISNAVVGGYDAAVMAWEAGMATGGPWAPAVAAAYTAASLAKTGSQIAAIKSQSFGSGGGGSAGGGGGGTAPQVATSEAVRGTGGSGGTIINIRGVDPSQIYTGEQIDGLISAINERGDQGMTIRTST